MDYNGEGTGEGGGEAKVKGTEKSEVKPTVTSKDEIPKKNNLNIIVDKPIQPEKEKSEIAELEKTNHKEAEILKKEWEKFEKDTANYPKLMKIKERIENATEVNDPVIYDIKQKLTATNGEKNITLKVAGIKLYNRDENGNPTGARLFAQTANLSENDMYIIFDLDYIALAPELNKSTNALDKVKNFNKHMGAPHDSSTIQLEIGGIITHELTHALDFYSKNGNFTSDDKKINEVNPEQNEYNYYTQKYLPTYWKK